ncbi:beta-galactosidase small subunit [Demequina litorisediminis]|uniref:beta-galactosidase n=1 Tax=Demequina litorisediminis TaxID=1849022 RepID=A0ABQ6ID87_9MICO|nr:hypothetical protein [Demequina litorisediminis]GMA35376.1 hypothetical protein GCM10025876_15800 [Demequina litorisediminis]
MVIDTAYTLSVAGKPGARMTTTVRADGTIEVAMAYAGSEQTREIPAVGTALTLPGDLATLTWFGDGPGASYRDRTEGTALGRWSSTVDDSLFAHVVPQADGNHTDVRWFAVTDADGAGLLVTALGQSVEAAALPATDDAISAARHQHEVERDGATHLAIDAAQAGVGFTWGENPVPGYSVNATEPREAHYVLSALQAGDASSNTSE